MTKNVYTKVTEMIPTLSDRELLNLHGLVLFLMEKRSLKTIIGEKERLTRTVFSEILVGTLKAVGLTNVGQIYTQGRSALAKAEGEIEFFINEHFPNITKAQKSQLYHMLTINAYRQIYKKDKMVAPGEVLMALHQPFDVFDRAYPGYIEAGLASIIFEKEGGNG